MQPLHPIEYFIYQMDQVIQNQDPFPQKIRQIVELLQANTEMLNSCRNPAWKERMDQLADRISQLNPRGANQVVSNTIRAYAESFHFPEEVMRSMVQPLVKEGVQEMRKAKMAALILEKGKVTEESPLPREILEIIRGDLLEEAKRQAPLVVLKNFMQTSKAMRQAIFQILSTYPMRAVKIDTAAKVIQLASECRIHLQSMDISFIKFSAAQIAELLPLLPNLKTLVANGCEIDSQGIKALVNSIATVSLDRLDLAGNNIGDEGAKAIANARVNLRSLDLQGNNIGDEGAKAIANEMVNLRSLDLQGNNIGNKGAKAIAKLGKFQVGKQKSLKKAEKPEPKKASVPLAVESNSQDQQIEILRTHIINLVEEQYRRELPRLPGQEAALSSAPDIRTPEEKIQQLTALVAALEQQLGS